MGAHRRAAIIAARLTAFAVVVLVVMMNLKRAGAVAAWLHDAIHVDIDAARGVLAISVIVMITIVAMLLVPQPPLLPHQRDDFGDRMLRVTTDHDGEPRVIFRDEATRKKAIAVCNEMMKLRPLRSFVTAPTIDKNGKILKGYDRESETLYMPDTPPKGDA